MFQKVLINDDHDAILDSIAQTLSKLEVSTIEQTQYCDEAYLKIRKADLDAATFDLLITDLSFKKDHRRADLDSGEALIQKLRGQAPNMPIIVYSMKNQLQKVRQLVNTHEINAYVCKDRKGAKELEEAIKAVSKGQRYVSPQVAAALKPRADLEIQDFDIQLLKRLSQGLTQEDISAELKARGIAPNSLSTIEKRLNKLRFHFKANNVIHLVATAKDLGLI
jgi:DNA-binding NarL/FixJ family response regulator